MYHIQTSPEGVQARFHVYEAKRLVASFVREGEAQAYLMQKRKAARKAA